MEIEGTTKTWDQIKDSFMEQFLPINYQMHLKMEFRNRKQRRDESAANFILSMRAILKKSGQQLPEADAVDFVIQNMIPEIAGNVILFAPKTFADLKKQANAAEMAMKTGNADSGQRIHMLNTITTDPNSKSRRRCSFCHKLGHIQTDCWHISNDQQINEESNQ